MKSINAELNKMAAKHYVSISVPNKYKLKVLLGRGLPNLEFTVATGLRYEVN